VITLDERAGKWVLVMGPGRGGRMGCGFGLLVLALVFAGNLGMAVLPPRIVSLDCDHGRGSCIWNDQAMPLKGGESAELLNASSGSSRGVKVHQKALTLKPAGGASSTLCVVPEDFPEAQQLAHDAEQLNAFFADAVAPKLSLQCPELMSTGTERLYYPIGSGVLLLLALVVWRAVLGKRRIEVDPVAKVIRARGAKKESGDYPFAQIAAVEVADGVLRLKLRDGSQRALAVGTSLPEKEVIAEAKSRFEAAIKGPPA